ncbi:MAG: DMT family transporter [Bacteroidetes bacterium]|nr:DMT family transporter [Bacteroidota bacterium]
MSLIKIKISTKTHGSLFVLLAVCFWGSSAPLAKFLITNKYSTVMVVQTRTLISFLVLAGWFLLVKPQYFKIERRDILAFAILGTCGLALTNFFYYFTIVESTVATAILLQYTAPVLVVVYTGLITRTENISKYHLFTLMLAVLGCVLAVTNGSCTSVQIKGWAMVTGPLSALTYALQIVLTKRLLEKYSLWTVLILMFGFASLFWLIIHPPWIILSEGYTASDWTIFFIFALVSILVPQAAFAKGLSYLGASTAGILTTLEPIVAIGLALIIVHESIGILQAVGGALVLTAVCILHSTPSVTK